MSGITFTRSTQAGLGRVHDASATLPDGMYLHISAAKHGDTVEIYLSGERLHTWIVFTAEQARAVAMELLACVDAHAAAAAPSDGIAAVSGTGGMQ